MIRILKKKPLKKNVKIYENSEAIESLSKFKLSADIDYNIAQVQQYLGNSFDLRYRKFKIDNSGIYGAIIFIEILVNSDIISEHIIKPLMIQSSIVTGDTAIAIDFERVKDSMVTSGSVTDVRTFDEAVLGILSGDTLVLIDGYDIGLKADTKSYVGRNIDEPILEPTVKGPKEGFVEKLRDNLCLIRMNIRDPNLSFDLHTVGRRSKKGVVITYIRGIADQKIVDEARRRVEAVDIDGPIDVAQLQNLISDSPNSLFPLVQTTERTDKLVSGLLEGRVGIIVEGSPGVTLVPVTLPILMQSPDDYYEKWVVGSFIRLLRHISIWVTVFFPALYIAVTSFHPGLLPTNMVLSLTGSRGGVPFPAFVEALIMQFVLELLQEASIRLPKTIGQTVSIVGGLVIGQSAVEAGIISPIMVIVISVTAISSYAVADYSLNLATRILRLPFIFLATFFGAYGILMGALYVLGYAASLKSFGIGYLEPITPYLFRDWKDALIRGPIKSFKTRPKYINANDDVRQNTEERKRDHE